MTTWKRLLSLVAFLVGCQSTLSRVAAHEPSMDYPTIKCLGMLWSIDDPDQKAKVSVEYQKAGTTAWKKGYDLFRVQTAALPKTTKLAPGATLFAGSIVDLEEDTAYKIKLTLTGLGDKAVEKILDGRTRPEPKPVKGDRVLHVVPGDGGGTGTKDDPFKGLKDAQTKAQAGDVFLLHKGVYDGPFKIERQGTRENPITWRGAGDGDAILDGGGKERAVDGSGAKFVRFENLTLRNAVFLAVFHRSEGCVVNGCKILANEKVAYALTAGQNAKELYVANNFFEGPTKWPRTNYPGPKNKSPWGVDVTDIRAVVVSGVGHVICHNSLNNFGDGIDTAKGTECACIDIYNNEISNMVDDGIELDESHRNVRCFDNRITNCHVGISAQPVLGGPVYVFRNCIFNTEYTPFKLHNSPSGLLAFHNTSIKSGMPMIVAARPTIRNCVFRNNLFVGGEANYAAEFSPQMTNCDFDYDGFAGGPFKQFWKWNNVRYSSIDELRTNGAVEKHAKLVNLATCFANKVEVPRDFKTVVPTAANDLRLGEKSEAIGAGVAMPNFNDGFQGSAPDMGALQHGTALPHFGPRK